MCEMKEKQVGMKNIKVKMNKMGLSNKRKRGKAQSHHCLKTSGVLA